VGEEMSSDKRGDISCGNVRIARSCFGWLTIKEESYDTTHGCSNQQEKRDGEENARGSSGHSASTGDASKKKGDSKGEKCQADIARNVEFPPCGRPREGYEDYERT
jgi:hypothetical protein